MADFVVFLTVGQVDKELKLKPTYPTVYFLTQVYNINASCVVE